MNINDEITDDAVLAELGGRLHRHRLARNWTQAQTAARAGVGQATVQRAERGESVQMTSMVKLLRTLELLEGLDAAIPASIELPIAHLEREQRKGRRRARARTRHPRRTDERRWRWADETEPPPDPPHPPA